MMSSYQIYFLQNTKVEKPQLSWHTGMQVPTKSSIPPPQLNVHQVNMGMWLLLKCFYHKPEQRLSPFTSLSHEMYPVLKLDHLSNAVTILDLWLCYTVISMTQCIFFMFAD